MTTMSSRLLSALFVLGLAAAASSQARNSPSVIDQVYGVFTEPDRVPRTLGPLRWVSSGSAYTVLEPSKELQGGQDIVRYDAGSGRRQVDVAAMDLLPADASAPPQVEDYAWSRDGSKLLVFTNVQQLLGDRSRGDYWVLDRSARSKPRKLGGPAGTSPLRFAAFSPQGDHVAYVLDNDLWVENVRSGAIARLTTGGSFRLTHGVSDTTWTCCRPPPSGFRWSPDGSKIAYWQFDLTALKEFPLINETDAPYPFTIPLLSPLAGEQVVKTRVGVVSAGGGPTVWLNSGDGAEFVYVPRMEWAANSHELILQSMNRSQTVMRLLLADASTGRVRELFREHDSAWVDVIDEWQWLRDRKRVLWVSDQDGWRHLYAVSRDTGNAELLTPGDFDVISVAHVDERRGWIYFIASPRNPTQRYLYRVPLGGRAVQRVTGEDTTGTNDYDISPDGRWAIHTFSTLVSPPVIQLVRLPEHRKERTLVNNERLKAFFAPQLLSQRTELFRIGVGDGVQLDGWLIRPRQFDPARKYPLFINVYGEPGRQNVLDQWGSLQMQWHRFIADQGYLVASVDNRGTPSPRGRAWRKVVYGALGELSSREQADAVRALAAERSYIDSSRVAIWGKSGGGSAALNAMFRYPDVYHVGIAVTSVPDQRLHHGSYQERYMRTPAENPDGYRRGSPIDHAEGLRGDLLLIHGTGDPNTRYQGLARLTNRLIELRKPFDLVVYPNRSHCLCEGPTTTPHMYSQMTRYLLDHLPAGPQ